MTRQIRPIVGVRKTDWEFIVNPIVDIGFGKYGAADFTPAARLARKLGPDLFAGLEYYADFGEIGHFGKPADQQRRLRLTAASDRFVVKTIMRYAFPLSLEETPPSRRPRPDRSIQCRGRRREWRSLDNGVPSPLRFPATP